MQESGNDRGGGRGSMWPLGTQGGNRPTGGSLHIDRMQAMYLPIYERLKGKHQQRRTQESGIVRP